jgi:hypothetical protein
MLYSIHMTQRQKLILILFGLADLIVIGLLFSVALRSGGPTSPPPSTVPAPIAQCPRQVLDTCRRLPMRASFGRKINYSFRCISITPPPPAGRQRPVSLAGAGQHRRRVERRLPTAPRRYHHYHRPGVGKVHRHQAQVSGETMRAWANHTLSDAELAAQAQYRRLTP